LRYGTVGSSSETSPATSTTGVETVGDVPEAAGVNGVKSCDGEAEDRELGEEKSCESMKEVKSKSSTK
jgi:hypothetical protein